MKKALEADCERAWTIKAGGNMGGFRAGQFLYLPVGLLFSSPPSGDIILHIRFRYKSFEFEALSFLLDSSLLTVPCCFLVASYILWVSILERKAL